MLERLVDYIAAWPEERVAQLLAQDIALCKTWIESQEGTPGAPDRFKQHQLNIAFWQTHAKPVEVRTAGRRHQLLLRDLIDMLQTEQFDGLRADEIAFLCAMLDLIKNVSNPAQFKRINELLAPYASALLHHRKKAKPSFGLPALSRRIQYATEKEIRSAPVRETRLLAGIEMPCRGPVMTCPAHLRILGDVPDQCTVVVEGDAHCCVDGYLLGRVLSKRQCEVRGNISGVAVVLYGDVRARSIINNAHVVAKLGSVHAINAQGPRLVFAGKGIHIADTTMLGHFITREMLVDGEVRGGRIQVADLVKAKKFGHLGSNQLSIVLRRELSCADFGEITGAELNRLLSQAYRLRGAAHNFDAMAEIARRDVEHKALSALMFIFGGGETHKKLEEMAGIQRRLSTLTRVLCNLSAILENAEEELIYAQTDTPFTMALDQPLMNIESDAPIDPDLAKEHEDTLRLQQKLSSRKLDRQQTSDIMSQIHETMYRLFRERETVEFTLAKRGREMLSLEQYETLLAGSGKTETKLQLLQRIFPALRKQPENSPMAARLKTAFITLALRTIDRQLRAIKEYEEQAGQCRKDFNAVSERLGKDFQIRVLENPSDADHMARATGCFEQGVTIYMDLYSDNVNDLPKDKIISTPEDDGIRTYVRANPTARFHLGA